jgi:hypothetical protein
MAGYAFANPPYELRRKPTSSHRVVLMLFNAVPPAKDGFTTYLHEAEASARRRAAA